MRRSGATAAIEVAAIGRGNQSDLLPVNASDLSQLNPFAGYEASNSHSSSSIMLDPRFNRYSVVSPYREVDPQVGRPSTLSTPLHDSPRSILFTPDDRSIFAQWGMLPGFEVDNFDINDLPEGFDAHEYDWKDLILLKDVKEYAIKGRLKEQLLPTKGKIRFVPDGRYNPNAPLPKGISHGFIDRFGNEWLKGPSRTEGEPLEWDVQLSEKGKRQLGHLSKDGKYINVSLKGRITHK